MLSSMLTDWARRSFKWILDPLSRFLAWARISPNALTILGVVLNIGVAYILSTGQFLIGALAVMAAACFDALDGSLARYTGRASAFGAFLDSTMDRYSESFVYLGLLVYYSHSGALTQQILVYATIIGSLLVSYTRARAEGIGVTCKEGLLTRVERTLALFVFLLINQMEIGLWILAVLSNATALQRIWVVWRKTDNGRQPLPGDDGH
jgi:CDP-diacylglycerol---glycerol-3-phosphate 3-phosphatidyltransferase